VGGIFGGIFGGRKKRHEAQKIVDQLFPQMQAIQDAYDGFQLDYASALGQLEQLKQQAFPQLEKLGSEGRKYERAMFPYFDQARGHIEFIEKERQRRAGLVFGPPQFATGGVYHAPPGRSSGMAVLHEGEKVLTRTQATEDQQGGNEFHFHINTLDPKTMSSWLRNGARR
jgi:hypothetical protein